jgi:hypothetical protein
VCYLGQRLPGLLIPFGYGRWVVARLGLLTSQKQI